VPPTGSLSRASVHKTPPEKGGSTYEEKRKDNKTAARNAPEVSARVWGEGAQREGSHHVKGGSYQKTSLRPQLARRQARSGAGLAAQVREETH